MSAIPSAMQWWIRASSAEPVPTPSIRCSCQGDLVKSSGVLTRSLISACSSAGPPGAGTAMRWMWDLRSKCSSSSQTGEPIRRGGSTTFMRKRGKPSSRCSSTPSTSSSVSGRSKSSSPDDIIRLVASSIRSHAVSTLVRSCLVFPIAPTSMRPRMWPCLHLLEGHRAPAGVQGPVPMVLPAEGFLAGEEAPRAKGAPCFAP